MRPPAYNEGRRIALHVLKTVRPNIIISSTRRHSQGSARSSRIRVIRQGNQISTKTFTVIAVRQSKKGKYGQYEDSRECYVAAYTDKSSWSLVCELPLHTKQVRYRSFPDQTTEAYNAYSHADPEHCGHQRKDPFVAPVQSEDSYEHIC